MAVEQKVVTVSNTDEAMNAEITAQVADNWIVGSIIPSGSDVIILFSRINSSET